MAMKPLKISCQPTTGATFDRKQLTSCTMLLLRGSSLCAAFSHGHHLLANCDPALQPEHPGSSHGIRTSRRPLSCRAPDENS